MKTNNMDFMNATNNMDFMNDLARDCFNYIVSDENFLPNVKKVFGIESTVVSDFGSDNKEYIFIGGGCGITYLKFDRLSKKGIVLDDIEYNVINNIHAYIANSFTDKENAYYLKIGNPIMAVITQDQQIQIEIYSRIVKFAKEVLGIKNISYVSVLD